VSRAAGEASGAAPRPWYADGLRFSCTGCGKCCHNHGDGFEYVYSTRRERQAIARSLGVSLRAFEREYCENVDGFLSFRTKDKACVFLDGKACGIYALRPAQCRSFPFWAELLEDRDTWERDVASFCPGVGQGALHDADAIRTALRTGP
jgi:Fe-S-cluster containining protein